MPIFCRTTPTQSWVPFVLDKHGFNRAHGVSGVPKELLSNRAKTRFAWLVVNHGPEATVYYHLHKKDGGIVEATLFTLHGEWPLAAVEIAARDGNLKAVWCCLAFLRCLLLPQPRRPAKGREANTNVLPSDLLGQALLAVAQLTRPRSGKLELDRKEKKRLWVEFTPLLLLMSKRLPKEAIYAGFLHLARKRPDVLTHRRFVEKTLGKLTQCFVDGVSAINVNRPFNLWTGVIHPVLNILPPNEALGFIKEVVLKTTWPPSPPFVVDTNLPECTYLMVAHLLRSTIHRCDPSSLTQSSFWAGLQELVAKLELPEAGAFYVWLTCWMEAQPKSPEVTDALRTLGQSVLVRLGNGPDTSSQHFAYLLQPDAWTQERLEEPLTTAVPGWSFDRKHPFWKYFRLLVAGTPGLSGLVEKSSTFNYDWARGNDFILGGEHQLATLVIIFICRLAETWGGLRIATTDAAKVNVLALVHNFGGQNETPMLVKKLAGPATGVIANVVRVKTQFPEPVAKLVATLLTGHSVPPRPSPVDPRDLAPSGRPTKRQRV